MIKSLKDLLDKFSRFTNSLVYDGGICKRLSSIKKLIPKKEETEIEIVFDKKESKIDFPNLKDL